MELQHCVDHGLADLCGNQFLGHVFVADPWSLKCEADVKGFNIFGHIFGFLAPTKTKVGMSEQQVKIPSRMTQSEVPPTSLLTLNKHLET